WSGKRGREKKVEVPANGPSHGAETRDEIGENLRRERLVAVAFRQLWRIVHFDHESVRTGSERGEGHLRNKFTQSDRVGWIDNYRQMCFGFQDGNGTEIERVACRRLEGANTTLAE